MWNEYRYLVVVQLELDKSLHIPCACLAVGLSFAVQGANMSGPGTPYFS